MIIFEYAVETSAYILLLLILWKVIIGVATGSFVKSLIQWINDLP